MLVGCENGGIRMAAAQNRQRLPGPIGYPAVSSRHPDRDTRIGPDTRIRAQSVSAYPYDSLLYPAFWPY